MSTYSRNKGKQHERDLAEWMSRVSGTKYRRVPMSGALHLDWPGDVMKIGREDSVFDGVLPEAKNCNQISVPKWIGQTEGSALDAGLSRWFICFRYQAKHYYILPGNYFEELIKKARQEAEPKTQD